MLIIWLILILVFFIISQWLLITLLLLEIIAFIILLVLRFSSICWAVSDYYLISLFTIFVIEGVIGLAGIIYLVRFTGSDYISSSSVLIS